MSNAELVLLPPLNGIATCVFLPVDWCRKALPCLSEPSAASRLNKLAPKPPAAHPGPLRGGLCGAGAPRQPEHGALMLGRAAAPPEVRGAGGSGTRSRRDPPPSPRRGLEGLSWRERCRKEHPSNPRHGKCCVGSVVGGRSLLTFRCIRRWGEVAFWFRLFFLRSPPHPPPIFIVPFEGFGLR